MDHPKPTSHFVWSVGLPGYMSFGTSFIPTGCCWISSNQAFSSALEAACDAALASGDVEGDDAALPCPGVFSCKRWKETRRKKLVDDDDDDA